MLRRSIVSSRSKFQRSQISQPLESLEQRVLFAAGDLDPGFSGDGKAEVYDTSTLRSAFDVEVVAGNKTLIAGVSQGQLMVQRFKSDGTPDTTFGNSANGRTLLANAGTAASMAVRADGKIVLATFSTNFQQDGGDPSIKLIRLNSNGSVDTSFGGGDGIVNVASPYVNSLSPAGLKVLSNNKIVIGINTQHEIVAARFNSDGTPDTTFGGDGFAAVDVGSEIDFTESVLVASDGSVFVGGASSSSGAGPFHSTLVKFKSDGSGVDSAFGGGILQNVLDGAADDSSGGTRLGFAANGKLLFGGSSGINMAIARIDPVTGAYDNSFSGDGRLEISTGSGGYPVFAVQTDGKLVVATGAFNPQNELGGDFFVYRFKTDGTPDAAWNSGKPAIVDFYQGDDSPVDIAIQSDGKIVATGFTRSPAINERFQNAAVVRLTTSGKLDTGFSGDGKAGADFPGVIREAAAVAVQSDGKTVVGGTWAGASSASPVGVTQDFFLTRYNTNGTLDASFGAGGTVQRDVFTGQFDELKDILIQPNGKIVAVGTSAGYGRDGDVAVARFNADGSIDTTFGGGKGKVAIGLGGADVGEEVAIRPDGKILINATCNLSSHPFNLIRLNSDGSIDKTFDLDGILHHTYGKDIAVTPDSKTLIAGPDGITGNIIVTRLNSNGSIDTAYGNGGRTLPTRFTEPGTESTRFADLASQGGKAVVLTNVDIEGDLYEGYSQRAAGLIQFTTAGVLDSSFGGGDGREYFLSDNAGDQYADSVAIDSQSRIVITGQATPPLGGSENRQDDDVFVLRVTSGGQADSTFGAAGFAFTDFNEPAGLLDSSESGVDVAVGADGRISVAARIASAGGYGVARYLGASTTPPAQMPSISIADANIFEGNSGTKLLNFAVSLSSASTNAVTVKYQTKNQTAGEGDYGVVTSASITFAPGETSKTISIVTKGDTKVEADETFRIELFDNLNATLGDSIGVGTIKNDD